MKALVALAVALAATLAGCSASPLSPSEQSAIDTAAKNCLEAAFQRPPADAGADAAREGGP